MEQAFGDMGLVINIFCAIYANSEVFYTEKPLDCQYSHSSYALIKSDEVF